MSQPFTLGVNYWARHKAMTMWRDYDAGEIREDFAVIKELGMTLVRVFLLWDDFQPEPNKVSSTQLAHLASMCDIAEANQLKLDVTFFTGHMSGPNWSPLWLLEGTSLPVPPHKIRQVVSRNGVVASGYRNPFHDPIAIEAEDLLLKTVVQQFKDHPAIGMWNLGNEPDLFAEPHDAPSGKQWVRDRVATIQHEDTQHPITCGLHADSLWFNNGLRVNDVYSQTDVAVMHAYPMYISWAKDPLDPHFVPFTASLTSALCGKPVLMEEWGGCTTAPGRASETWEWESLGNTRTQFMASEEDFAQYVSQVLPNLVDVGATGSLMWCFADYVEALWDKPPCDEARHERFFGLVRPDGSLKPHAKAIQAFAQTNPTVQAPKRQVVLDITPEAYYENPEGHAKRLYEQFLQTV